MRNHTQIRFLLFLAGALGFLLLLFFNPEEGCWFPPCPFHFVTGLYCPGCGSLRSLHYLLNGEIRLALSFNPLMVLFIPVLVVLVLFPQLSYKPWVAWGCFVILILYWLLRNIPLYPFCLLAPGV